MSVENTELRQQAGLCPHGIAVDMDSKGIVYESHSEQMNNAYPCFCCGICCTKYQVHLDMEEAQEVAAHLNLPLQQFLDEYTDTRWPGEDTFLIKQKEGVCIFLTQDSNSPAKFCRIHEFKPSSCRKWSASLFRRECRQGLSRDWELSVNESGEITGSPANIKKFKEFLKTLE